MTLLDNRTAARLARRSRYALATSVVAVLPAMLLGAVAHHFHSRPIAIIACALFGGGVGSALASWAYGRRLARLAREDAVQRGGGR